MLAKIWSAAVRGIDGYSVAVELDIANGLPNYTTVGLPDSEVRESRERVASALRNSGYEFPSRRVTVNLAPAQWRKRGTQFDLPVALGVLAASGQAIPGDWMGRFCFLGELALDGGVKPVPGTLPMAAAAKSMGMTGVIVPKENAAEAARAGMRSYGVESLRQAAQFVAGGVDIAPAAAARGTAAQPLGAAVAETADLADVKGQSLAKRALEIAAAGGHHLLMTGSPGSGKSMLACRLPGILPPLDDTEALEVEKILSVIGRFAGPLQASVKRPFRAPHQTVTEAALTGGGNSIRPGEVSLAHGGVLFLDELPEFRRECLEALRVPLETGVASVSRLKESAEYPARFLLAAAMNPCPCGWLGHPRRECLCTPIQVRKYRGRVSGPLLDRIDLQVEVSPLAFGEWADSPGIGAETSERVRARVLRARDIQKGRWGREGVARGGGTNAMMGPKELAVYCRTAPETRRFLEQAAFKFALTARSLDRALKVARTIADLEPAEAIGRDHVAEALSLSGREKWSQGGGL